VDAYLSHACVTWRGVGAAQAVSTVIYLLEPIPQGTRLSVHHIDITSQDERGRITAGWRTSLDQLARFLSHQHS